MGTLLGRYDQPRKPHNLAPPPPPTSRVAQLHDVLFFQTRILFWLQPKKNSSPLRKDPDSGGVNNIELCSLTAGNSFGPSDVRGKKGTFTRHPGTLHCPRAARASPSCSMAVCKLGSGFHASFSASRRASGACLSTASLPQHSGTDRNGGHSGHTPALSRRAIPH